MSVRANPATRGLIICLAGVAVLVLLVETGLAFTLADETIARAIEISTNSYTDSSLLSFFTLLQRPVDPRVDIGIAFLWGALLVWQGQWRIAWLPLTLLSTIGFEFLAKSFVAQPPPNPAIVMQATQWGAVVQRAAALSSMPVCHVNIGAFLAPDASGCLAGSFLSGAAARTALLAALCVWALWTAPLPLLLRLALAAMPVIWALLAGYGRLYLRWHWPSDIAAGYLLGGALFCFIVLILAMNRASRSGRMVVHNQMNRR